MYESGQHEVFLERLETRIKKHDRDIEKMCSHHYQGKARYHPWSNQDNSLLPFLGFIDSVRHLLRVRSEAGQLNKEVVDIDRDMRESSSRVITAGEKLVKVYCRPTEYFF